MTSRRELWRRVKAPRICFVMLNDEVAVDDAKTWLFLQLQADVRALWPRARPDGYLVVCREHQGGARPYMGYVKVWLEKVTP